MDATRRKWLALVLLAATQFMIVIDVSIVNVALGPIKKALDFSEANLTWVLNAYTLTFGGLLLLGGRLADLLGRRRVFQIGLVVFTLGSLLCGLSQNSAMLVTARALQGLGAAIVSPAALSILTVTFEEGAERNKALGVWGAVAGLGGAVGVLAGGFLTDWLSWRWIFWVNVPIGVAALVASWILLQESKVHGAERRFDVAGGVTGTAGLALLIYGFVQTAEKGHGWGTGLTAGTLIGAVVLLAGFLFIESRAKSPLMPLRLFKLRGVAGANLVGFLLGCAIFAMFYFLSRYMGEVQRLGPKEIGVRYLLVAGTIIVAAAISQALVTRVGVRPVLTVGMTLLAAGLAYFTFIRVNGGYARDLVPGFILSGVGLGFSFIPVAIGALEGVTADDAGVASGIVNTAQQVGGAVGLGLLGSIANVGTDRYLSDNNITGGGFPPAPALVQGYHWAFWVGVALSVLGIIASLVMIKGGKLQDGAAPAH